MGRGDWRAWVIFGLGSLAAAESPAATFDPNFFGAQALVTTVETVVAEDPDTSRSVVVDITVSDIDADIEIARAAVHRGPVGGKATYDFRTGEADLTATSNAPAPPGPGATIFSLATSAYSSLAALAITAPELGVGELPAVDPLLSYALTLDGTYTLTGPDSQVTLQTQLIASGSDRTPFLTFGTTCSQSIICLSNGVISETVSVQFAATRVGSNLWIEALDTLVFARASNGATVDLKATLSLDASDGFAIRSREGDFLAGRDDVSQIPLPATAWMLLLASAGLGLFANSRRPKIGASINPART